MTIRLFVGSDVYQRAGGAERALENSVRANCKGPVDITFMRQGSPGWDWGGIDAGWRTPFTLFRWFIPEHCNYEGKAIYMDADMVVLRDLQEMWDHPVAEGRAGAFCGRRPQKSDVILWHCANVPKWDCKSPNYRQIQKEGGESLRGSRLPAYWDHMDEVVMEGPERTGILHWTRLATQPYKPYPHLFDYTVEHRKPDVAAMFWEHLGMSAEEWAVHPDRIPVEVAPA